MSATTSADGTTIDYDHSGDGPPLILIAPATASRDAGFPGPLAGLLAGEHTVISYDRRGRGPSGDTAPHAPEREIEDLAALIAEVGGSATLYGISSGGVLATRAALALGEPVTRLAVYEPSLIVDDSRAPLPVDYVERLDELIAEGRPDDAVAYFLTAAAGVPEDFVTGMREQPFWAGMAANAHTIAYDGRIVRDVMKGSPLPTEWAAIEQPALVMAGGNGEQFMVDGARQLAELLPNAEFEVLEDQDHGVQPEALAPVLLRFLG